jgi:hemerythrin-like domain-containing protein
MSESISILGLMIKDHNKIEDLINDLEEKSKQDFESLKKAFNKFEWELEKHIFTEEKAIFTSYNPEDVTEGYKMLPELTKQHNYIVNTLNNWRESIRKKNMITDVYSFKEFLMRHKNFEEEKVYPKLDEALSHEDKAHIVAKINEITQV